MFSKMICLGFRLGQVDYVMFSSKTGCTTQLEYLLFEADLEMKPFLYTYLVQNWGG